MALENDPNPPESEMPPTPESPDENVLPSQTETQVPLDLDENQLPSSQEIADFNLILSFKESVEKTLEEPPKSPVEVTSESLDENQSPPPQEADYNFYKSVPVKENLEESPLDKKQSPTESVPSPQILTNNLQVSIKENLEESPVEVTSELFDENQLPPPVANPSFQEPIKENLEESPVESVPVPKLNGQQKNGSKMCRALFILRHTNNSYRQINKIQNSPSDTKVHDLIDQLLADVEWPKNQQYVIDSVCKKNKKEVSKEEMIGDKQEYTATVSNFKTTAFLKLNDGQVKEIPVEKNSTVSAFVKSFFSDLSSKVIQKHNAEFNIFIDCESNELIENGAQYQVVNKTQIEEVQPEIQPEIKPKIETVVFSPEIVHEVFEPVKSTENVTYSKYEETPVKSAENLKYGTMSKEKFVDARRYQPIDETKNIKRVPTFNTVQIGALYDLTNEHIQNNGDFNLSAKFNKFVIEGREKPELTVQFYKDVKSFSSRCEHLGFQGIEKITAFAYLKTGLDDYLTATIQEDLSYYAVVLTCTANTHKLDTNNETLRHKLSRFSYENVTHLLTSITKGINYVVLMGFPMFAVHNIGDSQLEKALYAFFKKNEDNSIFQTKGIQIDIFSDTYQNARSNASLSDVKELLHTLKDKPMSISQKFTDISWTLTPLDQFQPEIQLKRPVETSNDLLDRATDLLVNIHLQLNDRKVASKQVGQYMRVFGNTEWDRWFGMLETKEKLLQSLGDQVFHAVMKHRKGNLTRSEFSKQLDKFNLQCSNNWSSDETALLNQMKEKIEEVKDVEKLGLEFVGNNMDFLKSKVYGPSVYILAYKDNRDQEYKSNFDHLLTLPQNSTRLLFDQNLLEHPAIPNDYTCILKFESGKLMDQNVLRSNQFRHRYSVARCPNNSLREDLSPKGKNSVLEIPCPNQLCKREDCFWLCDRCFEQLHYDYSGYFYCKCGMAPIGDFEYSCKNNKTHGSEYTKYEKEQLEVCLEKLRLSDDKVILMLGQTGVGKSTFINALFNYFTFANLDEATDGELFTVIPSSFTISDEHYKETQVIVGEETEDERFAAGESATKIPKIYSLNYKSSKLIFIDTPGIADSNGSGTDKENMEMILNCIAPYKNIHGICVLLKPNESRLTLEFEYCIGELFTHLHRSVTKNLLFCFTNTQGTSFRPGETRRTLEAFFNKLEQSRGIQIQLTKDNMFCMDACAFRYLCARHKGIHFDQNQYETNVLAWENSASETQRLVQCITNIEPHSTTKTITLNDVRRKIISLSKPLAEATKACQYNIDVMEMQKERIQNLTGEEQDLKDRLQIQKFHTRQHELGYPRTVCTGPDCMTVKTDGNGQNVQVFEKLCHEKCYLKGVSVGIYPNTDLLHCWAMNRTENCRICGCIWSTHLHVTWEVIEEWILIEDETTRNNLNTLEGRRNEIAIQINKCKMFRDRYEAEKRAIYKIGAELANFLQQNALVPYNDAIIDYLKHEIKKAQLEASFTSINTKVEALEKALSEYLQQKKIIKDFANSESGANLSSFLCLESVQEKFNELCSLPLLGKSIKEMLNAELNGQRKQMEFHQGHFNVQEKRSRNNRKLIGMPDAPTFFNIPTSIPPHHTQYLVQQHPSLLTYSSSSTKSNNEQSPSIVSRVVNQFSKWFSNSGSKRRNKKGNKH